MCDCSRQSTAWFQAPGLPLPMTAKLILFIWTRAINQAVAEADVCQPRSRRRFAPKNRPYLCGKESTRRRQSSHCERFIRLSRSRGPDDWPLFLARQRERARVQLALTMWRPKNFRIRLSLDSRADEPKPENSTPLFFSATTPRTSVRGAYSFPRSLPPSASAPASAPTAAKAASQKPKHKQK
jgi:hypothetical protein